MRTYIDINSYREEIHNITIQGVTQEAWWTSYYEKYTRIIYIHHILHEKLWNNLW